MASEESIEVWTIGHSTRGIDEFISLLKGCSIGSLADVRKFPGSRRHPQFNQSELTQSLAEAKIRYTHFAELGGRRRARADSPNTAWRNEAFRGYADYLMTAAFRVGIERLLQMARQDRTAIMCAEALWWKCHRALIADYLKARSITVIHILGGGKTQNHPFTSAARIVNGRLSYSQEKFLELRL